MAEVNLPNNSENAKNVLDGAVAPPGQQAQAQREKKVDKIEGLGDVVAKKPSLGSRFKSTFFGGDAKASMSYVLSNVIKPTVQNMFLDAIQQGSERMVLGEVRTRGSMTGTIPNLLGLGHQAYNKMYANGPMGAQGQPGPLAQQLRQARATHDFSNFIVGHRAAAEAVIDRMYDLLNRDGLVTVADFMDLLGEPADYTMQRWGWVDLRGSQIVRVPQGYLMDLPKPIALD